MFCSGCGTAINPGQSFCPQCGRPAAPAVPPVPTLAFQVEQFGSRVQTLGAVWLLYAALVLLNSLGGLFFAHSLLRIPLGTALGIWTLVMLMGYRNRSLYERL